MKTTTITVPGLPPGPPARLYLAGAALALALLAIPYVGHAQGIVRGAQEGAYEANRAAGPVGGLSAPRSAPGSAGASAPSMACSGFPIGTTIIAAASTIVTIASTAIAS